MAQQEIYVLFISGKDNEAVEQAKAICRLIGRDAHLRVVEFEPNLELMDIITTPTLLRMAPEPKRQVSGDLSDAEEIADYLAGPWRPLQRSR